MTTSDLSVAIVLQEVQCAQAMLALVAFGMRKDAGAASFYLGDPVQKSRAKIGRDLGEGRHPDQVGQLSWNEFSVALTLASRAAATVPIGIAQFAQQFEIQNGPMAAASMIAILPALVLMIFGQRFVVQGLTGGALK
jgi:hypothetical protein